MDGEALLRRGPRMLALIILGTVLGRALTGRFWCVQPAEFVPDGYWDALYAASALVWYAARGARPSRRELGTLLVLGGLLSPLTWHDAMVGVGLAGLIMLTGQAIRTQGPERPRLFGYLSVAAFWPYFPGVIGPLFCLVAWLSPQVYDLRAFQLDGMVGFQPAFAALRAMQDWPWVSHALTIVYDVQPLMVVLVVLLGLQQSNRVSFDVWRAAVLVSLAGVMLYSLYPAAGTYFLCSTCHWAWPPPHDAVLPAGQLPALLAAAPDVWRNCTPSLHTALALLCLFVLLRYSPRTRLLGVLYTGLTLVSTLTCGAHWWNDWISAFPLTLWAVAASTFPTARNRTARIACGAAGLAAGVGWMALQRWGHALLLACVPLTLTVQAALVAGTLVAETWLWETSAVPQVESRPAGFLLQPSPGIE